MTLDEWIRPLLSDPSPVLRPNFSSDQLTSFTEFGIGFHSYRSLSIRQIELRFDEVRRWMKDFVADNQKNSIYLDTTTLYTVEGLTGLTEEPVLCTPATLFDLNNFVNCIVLYDRVLHLENEHLDSIRLNEALGNEPIVISLPVSSFDGQLHGDTVHSLGAILRGFWYCTKQFMEDLRQDLHHKSSVTSGPYREDAEEIKKAWLGLLGFSPVTDEWFDAKVSDDNFESDGPVLLQNLVGTFPHWSIGGFWREKRDESTLFDVMNECNYRSLFNLMVAYFLGVQYMPNSYRLPFRHFLYRRATTAQRLLPLVQAIDKEYRALSKMYFDPDRLELPFFLSAVLSHISSPRELFSALAEVRTKASNFRLHRAELDDALNRGDVEVAKKLRAAIQSEGKRLRSLFPYAPVAGGIAAVLAALGARPTPILLASVGILTATSLYPPDAIEKLKRRILHPEYWFLADVGAAANALTNAYPTISQLWGLNHYREPLTPEEFAAHFSKLKVLAD
jgi:hypothetical protein